MLRAEFEGRMIEYFDIDDDYFIEIFPTISQYSIAAMEGGEPSWALYKSIEYIVKHQIPGDIVECGVWRGGAMLLAALALIHFGDTSRKIYLYDTFAGMPRPGEHDCRWDGVSALPTWESYAAKGKTMGFGGTVEMVRHVLRTSHYPEENLVFVEGMVEDTIPATKPERISLLRLDTDFYDSTLHELTHLYPDLVSGGVLIIDDYGYFQGSRLATDKYIADHNLKILLNRINHTVRLAVKP